MNFQIMNIEIRDLLNNPNIRDVQYDTDIYFPIPDLNKEYNNVFKDVRGIPLPILLDSKKNNKREYLECLSFSQVNQFLHRTSHIPV